jgi:uncharacterized oxidoreductase
MRSDSHSRIPVADRGVCIYHSSMRTSNNTVLITGGASGIGLALAVRFVNAGSTVIVCGRREAKLREAKEINGRLNTLVADVSTSAGRAALVESAQRDFPGLNVLVNNAGIQRRIRVADQEPWDATREELATNLGAPIHLTRLLLPHLMSKPDAAIINITSGLAFAPLARTPVYSATKAALHSFTLSLRHQLKDTPVKVIEIAPPAVDTDLGGPGLHTFGVNVDEFADAVFAKLAEEDPEIGYGFGEKARTASRAELDELFVRINAAQP